MWLTGRSNPIIDCLPYVWLAVSEVKDGWVLLGLSAGREL